jgi:hypothetical protein
MLIPLYAGSVSGKCSRCLLAYGAQDCVEMACKDIGVGMTRSPFVVWYVDATENQFSPRDELNVVPWPMRIMFLS